MLPAADTVYGSFLPTPGGAQRVSSDVWCWAPLPEAPACASPSHGDSAGREGWPTHHAQAMCREGGGQCTQVCMHHDSSRMGQLQALRTAVGARLNLAGQPAPGGQIGRWEHAIRQPQLSPGCPRPTCRASGHAGQSAASQPSKSAEGLPAGPDQPAPTHAPVLSSICLSKARHSPRLPSHGAAMTNHSMRTWI